MGTSVRSPRLRLRGSSFHVYVLCNSGTSIKTLWENRGTFSREGEHEVWGDDHFKNLVSFDHSTLPFYHSCLARGQFEGGKWLYTPLQEPTSTTTNNYLPIGQWGYFIIYWTNRGWCKRVCLCESLRCKIVNALSHALQQVLEGSIEQCYKS